MRFLFLVISCLFVFAISAQDFKYESKIDEVQTTGFYNIFLLPEVNSHLNSTLSDIRIFDEKNIEIPYLLKTETRINYSQLFKEYDIISREIVKGCCTRLIIQNIEKNAINNLSLIIKNAEVQKKITLYGSDDQLNWFVVKNEYLLFSVQSRTETSEIKLLDFPLSNYSFYKIEINDSSNAPINILKVGYYDLFSETGKYSDISPVYINQNDSLQVKKSFVKISFNSSQYIDKLDLEISSPLFYFRNASICELKNESTKKRGAYTYLSPIQQIKLVSNDVNTIYFSNFNAKELYIVIENEDNQPLQIQSIKAYQLNRYLTAHLENKMKYVLKFGNPKLTFPSYDLKYFNDSIPQKLPILHTGSLIKFINDEVKREKPQAFGNTLVLWIIIGLVIVVLAILSIKMIHEIKR